MLVVFVALAPIFLLIALGHAMRRLDLAGEAFWDTANGLNYYLFFPCLIIDELAKAKLGEMTVLPMAAAMDGGVLVAAGLMLLARRRMRVDGPAFTSIFQGSIRPNTFVGLAGAKTLFGAPGLTMMTVGIAFVVPVVNVLSVAVMVRFGRGGGNAGTRAVVEALVRNPILLSVLTGGFLALSGIGRPPVAGEVIEILARAALPIGLLAVGAGLEMEAMRAAGRPAAMAGIAKLLLVPGVTALIGKLVGVQGLTLSVAVLFSALPCAASAYALAQRMGGDTRLAAAVITIETLLAALTIPAALALYT